jgi:hypothetical protein
MSFFDRFKPKDNKKKAGGGFKNPFANVKLPGQQNNFSGHGVSLGGTQPGKVIEIQLDEAGPLGVKIEKRPNSQGTAIVAMVVANSQAEKAGMKRGDILCFAGSGGSEEIMYEMFIQLAASDQRPLCFEIRRVQSKAAAKVTPADTTTGSSNSNHTSKVSSGSKGSSSAEAYARKQAVVAAAEKREKAAKAKLKPLPKTKKELPAMLSAMDRHRLEEERLARMNEEPLTEAARQARDEAKNRETVNAAQLGYNPYETSRATAGQARNATVAQQHGTMQGSSSSSSSDVGGTTGQRYEASSIPAVRPPADISEVTEDASPSAYFMESFETVVTANDHAAAISSVAIMRKLITNAISKGQNVDDEAGAAKFLRVRLANAKIKAAIVDVQGALDVMLSTGFQLAEEDGESVLLFPPGVGVEDWVPTALQQMESYEKS